MSLGDLGYRSLFPGLLALAAFLFLVGNLVRVQLFAGGYFRSLAEGNRVREETLHVPRGIIFDRNGIAMASNLPAFRLRECTTDGSSCHSQIISKEQAIDLEASGLSPNQSMEVDSARFYPQGVASAHLIGYVTEVTGEELASGGDFKIGDSIGRGGVEQAYNDVLAGKDGKELVEVDARGKVTRVISKIAPVAGQNITLTVDAALQKAAYSETKDSVGAVVVTNPLDGSVLALSSAPSFDPNVFTDVSLTAAERQERIKGIFESSKQPLFDRAISGTYPPGSTFKIVTATAGLESGAITEATTITDPGILVIGEYKFPNWKFLRDGGTQGTLNVVGAIQKSNDIFFYRTGEWAGVDTLGDYAAKMGVDRKLGIDLPGEAAGNFPTKDWREKYARSWYLGDTYHLAIGQGDLLVTPLQDNAWTGVIASGGKLCRPHVLQQSAVSGQQSGVCKDTGISGKTVQLVRQGMVEACSPGGTAWPLFEFGVRSSEFGERKIQIACKTGTAEFGDPNNRTHAWLTSFAPARIASQSGAGGPADKPEIAVTVIIEGGGEGDTVAAPVVKKIMEAWFGR